MVSTYAFMRPAPDAHLQHRALDPRLLTLDPILMNCPRDATELASEQEYAMEVHRCPQCHGACWDHDELDKLEATVASTEEERPATVMYAEIPSELKFPVCGKQMI